MKIFKRISIALAVLAGLSLTSCELTTESQSTFDESIVFADPTLTEFQIYSIYEVFGHTNCHRGRYLPYYGYNNDIEWYNSNSTGATPDVVKYNMTASNSTMNLSNGPYNELFTGIEYANLAIEGIRAYGNPDSNSEMAALLGEALCARALLYTELLKGFGEVPARFEPVTSETIYVNKADKDVIYKQLLADLEESFDYLEYTTNETTDRIGLAFAKGLYARLGLMASGYSYRPNEGLVGTGADASQCSIRLSNDEELQKSVLYPKILTALKDVINNSGLSLEEDYEDLWASVNAMTNTTAGGEIIYVIPFSNSRGRWNYTFAIRNEAGTTWNPGTSSHGGTGGPVPYMYYWYDENDVRRDLTCVNYLWEDKGTGDGTLPYPAGMSDWYFGKYRFEWQYLYGVPYSGGNDDGVKPVYMRYADILLMAAEVANSSECGARDESYAKSCLLEVLNRAYKGHEDEASAIVNGLSGESAVFEEIKKQRALEFCGEFLRKADLIRWNSDGLKPAMDKAAEELVAMREQTVGPITGFDYSTLGNWCWYYRTTDSNGQPSIVMYGPHAGETDVQELTAPDTDHDWIAYTNDSGSTTEYLDEETFISSTTGDKADPTIGFYYYSNPDEHQWWPIPQTTITNGQGYLVNDYGY